MQINQNLLKSDPFDFDLLRGALIDFSETVKLLCCKEQVNYKLLTPKKLTNEDCDLNCEIDKTSKQIFDLKKQT